MKILLVEATLKRFGRKPSGAVTFQFETMREMSNDEFALTDKYYQRNGFLAFKLDEVNLADIPDGNTEIKGKISDSQYLRKCMFSKWMNDGKKKEDFPAEYHRQMMEWADEFNSKNEGPNGTNSF